MSLKVTSTFWGQKMKTSADFRATREAIGVTQCELAEELGVDVRTIKRWESPDSTPLPEDAWDTLNSLSEEFSALVNTILNDGVARKEEATVVLFYYRDNWEVKHCSQHKRSCSFVNAATREAARRLEAASVDVSFEYAYPQAAAAIYNQQRPAQRHNRGIGR